MSFNLVDLVKDQISNQVKHQMGSLLGNQASKIDDAVSTMIPSLLGSLTNRAEIPGGSQSLFNAVQSQDDGLLENLGSIMSGSGKDTLVKKGSSLLSGLFGDSGFGSFASTLAGFTGLSKGNTSSLMGTLTPILLGVLKKKVVSDGLNPSGLLNLLTSQKGNIAAAMPMGLSDQINSSDFFEGVTIPASDVTTQSGNVGNGAKRGLGGATYSAQQTTGRATTNGTNWFKKLLPILGLLLLGLIGLKLFTGSSKNVVEQVHDTTNAVTSTASEAIDVDSLGNDFTSIFKNTKSDLETITDVESAKAALPKLNEFGEKLTGLTDTLGKVPASARGPLDSIITQGLATFEPLIAKLTAIPGVGDILTPILDPLLEKLRN